MLSIAIQSVLVPDRIFEASRTTLTDMVPDRLRGRTLTSLVYKERNVVGVVTVFHIALSRVPMLMVAVPAFVNVSFR